MQLTTLWMIAGVTLFVLGVVFFARRPDRSNEWSSCAQCGGPLGFDSEVVKVYSEVVAPERVNFCGRCARHRKIWGWSVFVLCLVFFALIWFQMNSRG